MTASTSPSAQHKEKAAQVRAVAIALVTVSDTRTSETDKNGEYLRGQLEELGHRLVEYRIIPDEKSEIEKALTDLIGENCDILIFNGGTGIGPRDVTIDIVEKKFEKHLPGFGEIFRMLSYEQIGSAAILSRAAAGYLGSTAVFCLPGSSKAVQLGWEKLIAPELRHLAWEQKRSNRLP
ncbi:MAG: molybdenum cofactor biosynthesis protein MoaB [Candidatus Omnitrophica bacterium]|nr:molybdenum cofactor biosynthesis protein MoaB [Candidatus Omnitrophota bacterium]